MMKKILLLSVLAIFTTVTTKAQTTTPNQTQTIKYGIKGGLNFSNLNLNLSPVNFKGMVSVTTKYKTNLYIGGFAEYPLTGILKNLYGEIGLQYVKNGGEITSIDIDDIRDFMRRQNSSHYNNHYNSNNYSIGSLPTQTISVALSQINVPVTLKYKITEGLALKGGLYLGYISTFTANEFSKDLGKLELGGISGIEYHLKNGVFFELNSQQTIFTSLNNDSFSLPQEVSEVLNISLKSMGLHIGVGYRF